MQFFVIKTKDLANLMFLCKTCSHGEGTNHLCRVVCSFTIQNLFENFTNILNYFGMKIENINNGSASGKHALIPKVLSELVLISPISN